MATFDADWEIKYDKNDNKDKVRIAGLEIEGTVSNKDNPLYGRNSMHVTDKLKTYFKQYDLDYEKVRRTLGYDGSEVEHALQPDSITLYKQGGSDRLKNFFNYAKENMKPNYQDGTHVHISLLPTDPRGMVDKLYELSTYFGMQMQKIFGRVSNWAQPNSTKILKSRYEVGSDSL